MSYVDSRTVQGLGSALFRKPEFTSAEIASLASRGIQSPETLTESEIKSLAGSVMTQAPNRLGTGSGMFGRGYGAAARAVSEATSLRLASLASKAMQAPLSLTLAERQSLSASALTQARNALVSR